VSLSVGFVLGRGRVQRACACGVEGSYSRSSSECRREKARLCACSNIPTISSDGSGGLAWQGRSDGVVSRRANVLLMCLQWTWAWASIAAALERRKLSQVCTRSRSTMT
jgi:hypothetical protein